MGLIGDDGELTACEGGLGEFADDEGERLKRHDDDALLTSQCVSERLGPSLLILGDAEHLAGLSGKTFDGTTQLVVEYATVGHDDDAVEDCLVFGVAQGR